MFLRQISLVVVLAVLMTGTATFPVFAQTSSAVINQSRFPYGLKYGFRGPKKRGFPFAKVTQMMSVVQEGGKLAVRNVGLVKPFTTPPKQVIPLGGQLARDNVQSIGPVIANPKKVPIQEGELARENVQLITPALQSSRAVVLSEEELGEAGLEVVEAIVTEEQKEIPFTEESVQQHLSDGKLVQVEAVDSLPFGQIGVDPVGLVQNSLQAAGVNHINSTVSNATRVTRSLDVPNVVDIGLNPIRNLNNITGN